MKDLFYETMDGRQLPIKPKKTNPLHKLYGIMEGKVCGDCQHHYFKSLGKKYPKCKLRKIGCTQKSDHSSRFVACGMFIEKET